MKYHDIQLTGSLLVTGSLTIPTGTTEQRPINPKSGSLRLNSSNGRVEIYTGVTGSEWQVVGAQTTSVTSVDIEYLLVAGGGGGGRYGGGGGAGGYLSSSLASVSSGSSFTVTVGGGGAGHVGDAQSGGTGTVGTDSSIAEVSITTITSYGGGGGGNYSNPGGSESDGGDGGSGGGGGRTNQSGNAAGGSGTVGQGNDGGGSSNNYASHNGGGGGGAGAAGASGVNGGSAGGGGNGLASSITGTSVTRAGGGGGSHQTTGTVAGGSGGGGTGYGPSATATTDADGDVNTGGGGGGTSDNSIGGTVRAGNGGSGVAIFAYDSGSVNCAGGIVGDAGNGRKYNQFNASGDFKVGSTSDFGIVTSNLVINVDASDLTSYSGTGNTWTDLSGNSNNFTLRNSPTYSTPLGGMFTLNGSNQDFLISTTPSELQGNPSLTVSGWFKRTGNLINGQGAWGIGGNVTNEGICAWNQNQTNEITIDVWSSGTFTSGVEYTLNDWTFVTWQKAAGAMTRANCTLWKNLTSYTGNALTILRSETGTPNINTQGVTIGRIHSGYGTPLPLQVAHFMVYDRVLTAAEVTQNYNATKTNFV